MAATTRPLTLGEILDRTVQLYRGNFLLFLGIAAAPAAVDVLVSGSAGMYIASRAPAFQTPANANVQTLLLFGLFLVLFLLIGLPLLLAVFGLAFGALNRAALQRNRLEATTIREAYVYSFTHFWRHLGIFSLQLLFAGVIPALAAGGVITGATIFIAVLAGAGSGNLSAILLGSVAVLLVIALIVAAVLVWIRFSLAFPVSVAEGVKAWPSLKRSNQLSKDSRGRIFVMYLLVGILIMVVYYALVAPIDILLKLTLYRSMAGLAMLSHPPLAMQVVNLFISFLERALVMPVYAIALLLFYNDQRTRQEGYDIELLMDRAGWSQLTPPPLPAAPVQSAIDSAMTEPSPIAVLETSALPAEEPAAPPTGFGGSDA
jgi:hypothetical protein